MSSRVYLSTSPLEQQVGVSWVRNQHSRDCVKETEVRSTVDDDSLDGHPEATVQPNGAVRLHRL